MDNQNKRTIATMRDVARLAGVSQGTVSNVLNGVKGVSSEKIKRVEAAVKELGYEQNALAKNLKTQKTGNSIYLVLPNISEPEFEEVFDSVSRIAEKNGFALNFYACDELPYKEEQILNQAVMFNADGILLVTCQPENRELFHKLKNSGYNVVSMYRDIADCTFVGIDVRDTLIQSINKQIDDGFKRIAMLTGPKEYSFDTACIDAYLNAMFSAGIDIKNEYLVTTEYDKESAMQRAIELLNSADKPEVIYVTSEILAEGVRKAIELTGNQNTDDPKLIVMKSRRWTDISVPNQESIILPYGKMAEMAFQILEGFLGGNRDKNAKKLIKPVEERPDSLKLRVNLTGGKVRVLLANNNAGLAVKNLCNDFEKKTGIRVQADLFNYKNILDTIKKCKDTNDYDVFIIDVPWVKELAEEGHIEMLEDYIDDLPALRERFPEQIFDAYSLTNGNVWTLPFSFTTQLLFYRKDLFDKLKNQRLYYEWYKEELDVPKTWEDYNKVARLFTKKFNPDSDTLYGTALGGRVPTGATSEYLPRIWAQDLNLFNGENAAIDKKKATHALENYVECYNYAHPDASDWWWDDEAMDFCQGNSAMMVQYSDQVTILRDRNISKVVGKTGFDVVPGNVSLFGGWSIGMSKHSMAKDDAFKFILWSISERMSIVNAVLGRIIPYKSVEDSSELLKLYPWHKKVFSVFDNVKSRTAPDAADGRCVSENVFESIIGRNVNDAIIGKVTSQKAVEKLIKEIEDVYFTKK